MANFKCMQATLTNKALVPDQMKVASSNHCK